MRYPRGLGLTLLAALVISAGLYGGSLNHERRVTEAKEHALAVARTKARKLMRDTFALAADIDKEAGNEPELSARLVAKVVDNRAKQDRSYWGGSDIINVIFARAEVHGKIVCQNSWTCSKKKRGALDWSPEESERALRIAQDEMDGTFTPPAEFAGVDHYLNEELADRKNVCWFKTHLVRLGKAEPGSHHVFYRTPTAAERKLLPKYAPECRGLAHHIRPHPRKAA